MSLFLPSEGAAPGEAGPLIFYREYAILADPTTGVAATYFDNQDLTGATLTRIEPRIDSDYGAGSPSPNLGADQFSVRWTGQVLADASRDLPVLHADRRRRPAVGGRRPPRGRLDRPRRRREQRHHRAVRGPPRPDGWSSTTTAAARWPGCSGPAADTPKAVVPADHLSRPRTGLRGQYYAGITLTGPARIRPDPTVNFNWGTGFADPTSAPN